jgi:hypothetical protein
MKSLIIELTRTGKAHSKLLSRDNQYLALCGTNPEQTFTINCEQDEFYDQVKNLRYNNANPAATQKAIDYCQQLVTDIFQRTKYMERSLQDGEAIHIRLVVNPLELAQLPFEFVRVPLDTSAPVAATLLADEIRTVCFTREVRQESQLHYEWPATPRILFAWAQPLESVPHEEQKSAFIKLLAPLARPVADSVMPTPDLLPFFTELPDASLASIAKKLREAVQENDPYTHVNILAHGIHNESMEGYDFNLVLCEKDAPGTAQQVNAKDLIKALAVNDGKGPVVVSLSACDSGNVGNVIRPAGSLVYQLHNAGIPCVFASQFPLTQVGSIKMIEMLYGELVNACDPRVALYKTRCALKKENSHDWASVVAYARFPENIDEQLNAARLEKVFRSMKTANSWSDHIFRHWNDIGEADRQGVLQQLGSRVNESINDLHSYMVDDKSSLGTPELRCEHLGLLASASKRKAEYLWRLSGMVPGDATSLLKQSTDELENAMKYYRNGFAADVGSHWNGVQYLSLKAVLTSSIADQETMWHVARYIAELDLENTGMKRFWAIGTLAELFLLQPLIKIAFTEDDINSSSEQAKKYIASMSEFDNSFNGYRESMVRQLERYMAWWPAVYAKTFPSYLTASAREMRELLPSMETLLVK